MAPADPIYALGQKSAPFVTAKTTGEDNVPLGNPYQGHHCCRHRPPANGNHLGFSGSCGLESIFGNDLAVLDGGHYKFGHIATLSGNPFRSGLLSSAQHRAAKGD